MDKEMRKKALSGDRDALKVFTLSLIKQGHKRNENMAVALVSDAYHAVQDAEINLGKILIDGSDLFKQDKDIGFTWMALSNGGQSKSALSLENADSAPQEQQESSNKEEPAKDEQKQKSNFRRIDPSISTLDPIAELKGLIGLENVKKEIEAQASRIEFERMRRESGFASSRSSVHFIFKGNPGTGKTTVARILGRLLKKIGHLQTGHVIEVSVPEMIGQFVGETPQKVLAALQAAVGGILFIDEAYGLLSSKSGNGDAYGEQAITTILKFMEDHRDNFTIIAAGYPHNMDQFLESNPGFKSRFSEVIAFHDYKADELVQIYLALAKDADYQLSAEAAIFLVEIMNTAPGLFVENFPNGRFVRNLFEDTVKYMALRVIKLAKKEKSDLNTVTKEDLNAAFDELKRVIATSKAAEDRGHQDQAQYNYN